jgi:hypothetical protein
MELHISAGRISCIVRIGGARSCVPVADFLDDMSNLRFEVDDYRI